MNTAAVITASCFTLFSVMILVFLFFTKNPLLSGRFKNYFRAGTLVYISGTILLLILSIVLKGVPVAFIVISELMIMTVFIVTYILIIRLSKILADAASRKTAIPEQEGNKDA